MSAFDTVYAKRLIQTAKTELSLEEVFWGSLCCRLKVEEAECKSLFVDGVKIGYNPEYIGKFKSTEMHKVKAVLAKSVLHLILGHHTRRGDRDKKTWQQAANMVAEAIIDKAGMELPNRAFINHANAEKLVEQIYDDLYQDNGQKQNGDGQGDQDQQPDPNGNVEDWPGDGDPDNPDNQNEKPTNADKAQEESNWKLAAKQAVLMSKGCGRVPAEIERVIEERTKSRHDWRELLRAYIEQYMIKGDYTWMRPNRRYMQQGIYLPSMEYGYDLMRACAYVDASGSVFERELEQAASEISKILEDFPSIEFRVNFFDTKIRKSDEKIYTEDDLPVKLKTRAGGGTKYTPIFEDIKKVSIDTGDEPKFVLIFTDLECSDYPRSHPSYPVIWCKLGNSNWGDSPPFGEILPIEVIYT